MVKEYPEVITRFLRQDERWALSEEQEMPLVIEANQSKDLPFLQNFLKTHSEKIIQDMATYGAVLLRGFAIASDQDFENTVLSLQGFQGISEAFMSEEGRIHPNNLHYVLYTNAVYKTGGTLYLGGFHSENYYSPDMPGYICFGCLQPSILGGETGLVNAEKIYQELSADLKNKLEQRSFFVSKWLVSEVLKRYAISRENLLNLCHDFDLPVVGEGEEAFILLYKPNVFEHPLTKKKALQINLFEIASLNREIRACFMKDYPGKTWFWHRFVWKLPDSILSVLEFFYLIFASFFYSPKESLKNLHSKYNTYRTSRKKNPLSSFDKTRVGSCFNKKEVKELSILIRKYYSSCLWKKGDILLVDNKKVLHAGMPGAGPRLIRAMIGNPLEMSYSFKKSGLVEATERQGETLGFYCNPSKIQEEKKHLRPLRA